MNTPHKLDNPVWNSLNETHRDFGISYEGIKFYHPQYCPFGGATNKVLAKAGIGKYADLTKVFFVVGEKPTLNSPVALIEELICNQMVLRSPIEKEVHDEIVALKSNDQRQALLELVPKVLPGYFKNKTAELGKYFGIYRDEKLVAACGERMKMDGFTEISAIVTHPDFTGNGFASQLIKHTTDNVFSESKIPYLHVATSNDRAIGVYERLGFKTRTKMSFWKLGLVDKNAAGIKRA